MAWPKPMPIVEVIWIDSNGHSGWRQAEKWAEERTDLTCRSVGYLLSKDREQVRLMQSQSATGCLADAIEIPRVAVLEIRVLEKALLLQRVAEKVNVA